MAIGEEAPQRERIIETFSLLRSYPHKIGALAQKNAIAGGKNEGRVNSEVGQLVAVRTSQIVFVASINTGSTSGRCDAEIMDQVLPEISDELEEGTPLYGFVDAAVWAAQMRVSDATDNRSSVLWSDAVANTGLRSGILSVRFLEAIGLKRMSPNNPFASMLEVDMQILTSL